MKKVGIIFVLFLACLTIACSSDDERPGEPQIVNINNPDAVLGRWDEIGGAWYFIFNETGDYIQYNGQTTSGTYFFERASNIIHCKVNGSDKKEDAFRINVTFENDKNLATFTTGSSTIKVKRNSMQQ